MSRKTRTTLPNPSSWESGELAALRGRQLRALVDRLREERARIEEQAVFRGATTALGERLAGVQRLELACESERARRRSVRLRRLTRFVRH